MSDNLCNMQLHRFGRHYLPNCVRVTCTIEKSLISESFMSINSALFVSRYDVELPNKDEMAAFLDRTIAELGGGDE